MTSQPGTAAQKAAKVRADIKAALKAGTLGTLPEGLTISVRTRYASCMSAIDIILKGSLRDWAISEGRLTAASTELSGRLLEIAGRHYATSQSRFLTVSLDSGVLVGCG